MIVTVMTSRRFPYFMLFLAFIIAFLLHLLLFGTAPMVTVIMIEMGLSHTDFGLVFAVAMVSLVLFRIPWGIWADRIGYLWAFRLALPLAAAAAVLRAYSPGYPLLLASQFLLGLGLAAVLPGLSLLAREWAPRHTGLATGIYVAGFAAGNAAALGLTPHLFTFLEWREVLLLYSGATLLVGVLWWGLARSNGQGRAEFSLQGFTRVLKDRYVWVLLLFIICSMGSYDTLATWLPRVLGFKEVSPALASFLPLGFFLAGPVSGFISDRFPHKRAVILGLGLVAVAAILGISYAPLSILALPVFLAGFATIGVFTISLSTTTSHRRLAGSVASVVGLTSAAGNLGPLVMPIIFGYLIDATDGYQASLMAVAVLAGVAVVLSPRVDE